MLGGDGGGGGGGASQQQQQQDQLDAAVAAGATAVLLVAGGGGDDGGSGSDGESTGGGGGAELYEAAVRLVAALRGRCPLLVEDRLDVATAAGCQGALLPESGVPVVVARRMVAASAGLLGRRAATAGQAAAAAADGANFVLMRPGCAAEEVTAARDRQRSGNAVPVLAEVVAVAAAGGGGGGGGGGGAGEGQPTPRLLAARADGLALPLAALAPVAAQLGGGAAGEGAGEAVATILAALRAGVAGGGGGEVAAAAEPQRGGRSPEARAAAAAAAAALPASQPPSAEPAAAATAATTRPTTPHSRPQPPRPRRRRLLTPAREALIADERALLDGAAALLSRVAPAVPELALLREAAAALEGRFSVAVVGEFNAGKSSVINALLGRRLLAEGPLPTTNEITELRYDDEAEELDGGGREEAARGGAPPPPSSSSSSIATAAADDDDDADQGRVVREADGRFVRYLRPGSAGAGLLREVNVVDTPGLNVVLERQERATEEYVPRADLVLFVMSADRPMTGSELRVLEYLRQWRKKVVFVLNKVDTLEDDDEGGDGDGGGGGGRGGGGRDGGRAGGGGRGASFSAAAAAAAGGSQGQGQGRSPSDRPNVRQVAEFVSSKAEELLAIARPAVLPVSARRALRAKLESAAAARAQLLEASSFSPPLSPEEVAASTASILARHPAWVPSGFGALEDFVYEFLAGGAEEDEEEARFGVAGGSGSGSGTDATDTGPPRGGEGLRLKLQTPLAVADALVGAAAAQLAAQRQGAEAQLRALSAVEGQLGRFGDAVRRDAASQRAAARALVDAAVERAGALVDRIVRLSNLGALSAYALGGGSGRRLPVAAAFDADVAAGGLEALSQRVAEHAGWLLANCESQSEYYAAYLASVPRPAGAAGAEGGGKQGASPAAPPAVAAAAAAAAAADANAAANAAPSTTTTTTTTAALVARSPALQAVAEFKPSAARAVLEEEVREAFLGTAGAAAGAQGAALIAAGLLPTGAEDAAAFAVASLASYVAVLNLPLRRAEIKAKVAKAAGRFADEVAARMEAEVDAATDATRAGVSEAAAPLVRAWEEELARVEGAERELAALAARLREMEVRVANV